jgi:nitrite reductase/ring-hydroxylating ferredoxin subunit
VLKLALAMGLGLPWLDVAAAQEDDPRKARPQEGDQFVFAAGERKGDVITPGDLPLGGPPALAYPLDSSTKVVRDGLRLNQVLLIRLDPEVLAEGIRGHAAGGIMAYSAICTHEGCEVTDWHEQTKTIECPCHLSAFDPKDGARVIAGPAPRRLPTLPLKVANGILMAAGGFIGRVGFQSG